jgi:two-component system chemotaxis response regulator CheY
VNYPKLLCVDDSQLVQSLVAKELDVYEVHLYFANNGLEALESCLHETPDLVMLDIKMPTMDGIEFLKKWKAELGFADTRIMIMTSETSREIVETVLKLGISDYLAKPFSGKTMVNKIARHIPLSKKEQRQDIPHTPRLFASLTPTSKAKAAAVKPAATFVGKVNFKTIKVLTKANEGGQEYSEQEQSLHDVICRYQVLLPRQSAYLISIIVQLLKNGKVLVLNGEIFERISLIDPSITVDSETIARLLVQYFDEQSIDSAANASTTQRIELHRPRAKTRLSS